MPLPLIPIVIVLGATAAYKVHKKNAALTPQRKMILETALNKKLASADYLKLADTFESQGLKAEATLLRNRAAMQDAPEEKKAQWRAAFKKGFMAEDPALVLKLAAAFEAQGATGAAADFEKVRARSQRRDCVSHDAYCGSSDRNRRTFRGHDSPCDYSGSARDAYCGRGFHRDANRSDVHRNDGHDGR